MEPLNHAVLLSQRSQRNQDMLFLSIKWVILIVCIFDLLLVLMAVFRMLYSLSSSGNEINCLRVNTCSTLGCMNLCYAESVLFSTGCINKLCGTVWNSHLSYLSCFKTLTCRRRKHRLLFSTNSSLSRDIKVFEVCKLATWCRQKLNGILIKYEQRDISTNLYRKRLILCKLVMFHNMGLTLDYRWSSI